ncbi:UNVERIFIED_CONTAM: Fatty acid synthase [Trichonephila clavipes]
MYMFIIGESWCEIHKYCPNDTFLSRHLAEEYITLSGPKSSLKTSVEKMQAEHISTKEAESYGCCRMCAATESLQKTLEKIMVNPKPRSSQWMSSSYSESEWNSAKLADASYFAHILVSPILLHQAMLHIPENAIVVEISPHALSRNVMMDRETEHIRLLEKDVNSTVSLLSCIGK